MSGILLQKGFRFQAGVAAIVLKKKNSLYHVHAAYWSHTMAKTDGPPTHALSRCYKQRRDARDDYETISTSLRYGEWPQ